MCFLKNIKYEQGVPSRAEPILSYIRILTIVLHVVYAVLHVEYLIEK